MIDSFLSTSTYPVHVKYFDQTFFLVNAPNGNFIQSLPTTNLVLIWHIRNWQLSGNVGILHKFPLCSRKAHWMLLKKNCSFSKFQVAFLFNYICVSLLSFSYHWSKWIFIHITVWKRVYDNKNIYLLFISGILNGSWF